MLAHGFELAMLEQLALGGLTRVEVHDTIAGGRPVKVTWMRITAAGRKALSR
jgi:hypothetical protein